jgi:hypothetical protein
MSQRRLWTGACVLAALLVFPRAGDAGIGEIILEMSGPRMIGFGLECRLTFSGSWESCKVAAPAPLIFAENQPDVKMWLSVGGKFFFSVDKTVNGQHYDTGEVKMWSFDPMLEFESKAWPVNHSNLDLQIYHGVMGVSYNVFYGDFPTFSNVALKLRPAGIVIPFSRNWGVDLSYDIRLYPRGVTAEDFGKVPLPDAEPSREAVHSFVLGFRWRIDKR